LFLSAAGLYGVVSYSVAQRTREIGIRAALGAGASDIVRLVLGEAFGLLVVGSLLGFALAVAAIRLTSSFVVTVPGIDLVSGLAMWVLVAVAVLLAYYLPARRAASLDPVAVLKVE
jgi:ABC-type antimicrobial peptide transport system permease subunit